MTLPLFYFLDSSPGCFHVVFEVFFIASFPVSCSFVKGMDLVEGKTMVKG